MIRIHFIWRGSGSWIHPGKKWIQVLNISFTFTNFVSLIFSLKLSKPFTIQRFVQFLLVNNSGLSVEGKTYFFTAFGWFFASWVFADPNPRSQSVVNYILNCKLILKLLLKTTNTDRLLKGTEKEKWKGGIGWKLIT